MSDCLVALDIVTDAIPIAAEEMSIHLSPGRRMVDDHTHMSFLNESGDFIGYIVVVHDDLD
jgi:hypothetical protein